MPTRLFRLLPAPHRIALTSALLVAIPAAAQQQAPLAPSAYAHAKQLLAAATNPLVYGARVSPVWLADGRFWYMNNTRSGAEFVIVDPARATRARAFDQARIAAALSAATGKSYDAMHLPFRTFEFAEGGLITVAAEKRSWRCNPETGRCDASVDARESSSGVRGTNPQGVPAAQPPAVLSPDGKRAAFIRDWNLWVRDVATGSETQLTRDGAKDYGYATDNAGWIQSDRAILLWSPDSRKIATFQQDQRNVGEMYLVPTTVGHPVLKAWKYPLPGDSIVTMIERVIIDVDGAKVTRLQMPPDQHRSSLCDHVACRGAEWADVEWYPDGSHLAFVSTARNHKDETLRIADASSGSVRDVMSEHVATQFESGNGAVNWRVLPASNEVIWFSERDGWGQLYLYDLSTGKLRTKITSGTGNVTEVKRIDEKSRTIWFEGVGKAPGDPYFRHLYRIGIDGKNLKLLTPEDADHDVTMSPSGRYFVDSYSRPDVPQVTVVRDLSGKLVSTIEKADISDLVKTGWKPPTPITVKARDGKTDLYGLMYTPTTLDSTKKYPIINHIYPGPQTGSVGGRGFAPARGDAQALAELGFVVVEIDGMGTPWRSKSFHDAYFARMGDNTLPDQVAGMRELAQRYKWIDLDRAGIYGHSGGGFAAADAMFRYPDFFKVGIAESGNHDNRVYEDDWGERYQGLLVRGADGDNYDAEANQLLAKNLKGKLLLAHGTMDDNVPPDNTMLVVDALIKADKDFDLLLLPNQAHGYGAMSNYMMRRRWDYFVKNLLGDEPPKEYRIDDRASSR